MKRRIKDRSLYLVASEEYAKGRSILDVAREAALSGVDIIQMREKGKGREELVSLGKELASICREKDIIFIVNDDPYLAKDLGADGVHLGQEDLRRFPLSRVREVVGDAIVGVSTHSIRQFKDAASSDVDYIAFGPVFETKTKDYSIGTTDVEEASSMSDKPVVFIGGIDESNIDDLLDKGARNIAVIRAIVASGDVSSSVKRLKDRMLRYAADTRDECDDRW